jgi:hypothetical protein
MRPVVGPYSITSGIPVVLVERVRCLKSYCILNKQYIATNKIK